MQSTAFPVGTLDDYLNRICEQLQLKQTQYDTAVKRYERVGEWLTEKDTPLERFEPEIFPQGSMLQRTTIRPVRIGKEVVPFDLDAVCRCSFDPHAKTSQSLYGSILQRLSENVDFKRRMDEAHKELGTSGKCVRLAYTDDDFYLDVVPTCKDPSDSEGIRLYMCNPGKWSDYSKPIETWKRTDPLRFAAWLELQSRIGQRRDQFRAVASVAPVPAQEPVDAKAPLRRIVQLLKRQRDLEFAGDKCRPTSIMLTTLAGRHYRGEASIAEGLQKVLDGIAQQIAAARSSRISVLNPADEMAPHDGGIEDLAAPLDQAAYEKFCSMIGKLQSALAAATSARGVPNLFPVLSKVFGDGIVKRAFNEVADAERAANLTKVGAVGVGTSDLLILTEHKASHGIQPVKTNDFHSND